MKNIPELTEKQFAPEVLQAAGPVLADFYANHYWRSSWRRAGFRLVQTRRLLHGRVPVDK